MRSAFILREQRGHIITPLPHLGLFCSRKNAKRAAKRRGYPFHLIYKVTRHEQENA